MLLILVSITNIIITERDATQKTAKLIHSDRFSFLR